MSFATNSSQQVSLFDSTSNLTDRKKKAIGQIMGKVF